MHNNDCECLIRYKYEKQIDRFITLVGVNSKWKCPQEICLGD